MTLIASHLFFRHCEYQFWRFN